MVDLDKLGGLSNRDLGRVLGRVLAELDRRSTNPGYIGLADQIRNLADQVEGLHD